MTKSRGGAFSVYRVGFPGLAILEHRLGLSGAWLPLLLFPESLPRLKRANQEPDQPLKNFSS